MIEPRKTGAYISRLRKERNWTQLQLAERLNVTHLGFTPISGHIVKED